jgi:hypothetical protein
VTYTTSADPLEARPNAAPEREIAADEGRRRDRVTAALAAARSDLRRCTGGRGGVLVVRVVEGPTGFAVDAAPGSSLDPNARACAVAALSRTFATETGSNAGGPAIPPSGFTSHFTVRW